MRKKARPTELSANLQPTSKDNSRSRLPSKGKIESGQPTQKKVHRKLLSIPDSYYFLNIYKNSNIDKSKRSIPVTLVGALKNLTMQDHHQKPEISSEEATPPAGNRMADAESAAKDKHRRASSQGEKVAGIKKSTSKSKNKSFFESHTDDRRQSKGITMVQKPSSLANQANGSVNFLKKLKKIWKGNTRVINTHMHTRDHSFLGGTKQKSPSNLNDSDKHGYGNLKKQSVVQKVCEGSANKMKKLDYNGDWPANSHHKNRSFDPKAILRSMKDATGDKQERQANLSGIKDTSKSQIKCRTVKEGKSKALNEFIQSVNRQLELAINQVSELKKDIQSSSMDKETFLGKVRHTYSFTESIREKALSSNHDQIAKLCERLMSEMKLTFDAVVDSMFANDDDSSKTKKVDKSISVDYKDILKQDPEQTEFLEGIKAFAKSQLKDWPKAEFKLHQFFEFFGELKIPLYKTSFDSEKQKLTKTYVDLLQKQFIFDEVLKIIEEENIDIENLFLAAFERLGDAAQKEEESMVSNSKEELSEMTESRKGSDDASNYSDQMLVHIHSSKHQEKHVDDKLKLNFNNIKEGENNVGFHEEFMKNLDNFSLSWRMQALKEMERGKRRPEGSSQRD